jgi:hypothetical protein
MRGVPPNLRDLLSNFNTYDAPFGEKLRLAVQNNLRKVRTRSNCCGNLGQPGC